MEAKGATAETAGWKPWGGVVMGRFQLLRGRNRARFVDTLTGCWFGPEQPNVAPAFAWALSVGIKF